MMRQAVALDTHSLTKQGLENPGKVFWNVPTAVLYEEFVRRGEGLLAPGGAISVTTGRCTGRSPNDKFIVQQEPSASNVWWGKVNRPWTPKAYEALRRRVLAYLERRDIFVQDVSAAADPKHRLPIRFIGEHAWQSLFVRNMFRPLDEGAVEPFTIIHAPSFRAVPSIDGTNSEVAVILNFEQRTALIAGSEYAGEVKKSIFTVLNYLLPQRGVLSMHCSANAGPTGDTALFFGLSGTGKTTLSSDSERALIGDDEHGWGDEGVFNFEGGCYAKVIHLSEQAEPEIYHAIHRFGSILENVVIDPQTRVMDLDADTITENTRASYPLSHIPGALPNGRGGHPTDIVLLTADAFGVMPPIARLSTEQALYHFVSGYTAKVAGTEKDLGNEPQATFSTCFGAPFMVLHPSVYAQMLGERIARHGSRCWLVNTGWSGGPYGVGKRFSIGHTRAMVRAALKGQLEDVEYRVDPVFGLRVPESCPGVPSLVLRPRETWADPAAYDAKAAGLARRFVENFKEFAERVPAAVRAAGPKIS